MYAFSEIQSTPYPYNLLRPNSLINHPTFFIISNDLFWRMILLPLVTRSHHSVVISLLIQFIKKNRLCNNHKALSAIKAYLFNYYINFEHIILTCCRIPMVVILHSETYMFLWCFIYGKAQRKRFYFSSLCVYCLACTATTNHHEACSFKVEQPPIICLKLCKYMKFVADVRTSCSQETNARNFRLKADTCLKLWWHSGN